MINHRIYALLLTVLISTISYSQKESTPFIPPLKIPLSLSASFGELRPDHYHSGIDIKTQGVTGKEVIAADEGFVYLILVSPVGFGKAIFLRHPSGFSTVYGHLDHFTDEIDEYVKAKQYENKSFAVTIYPPEGRFRFKKGETLGFSGNSGSSSGPHLHFEIRKTNGEKPINPLLFNLGIEDNLKPVIELLAIYRASEGTIINGKSRNIFINLTGADGNYSIPENTEIKINGLAGFGVSSHDYMNGTPNRFGINSIELQIDSIPWLTYDVNEFSFYETRYVNAHIDYETFVRSNKEIEKTFVLPNDKLSLYKNFMNNGLYDFNDNRTHTVKIIVKDGKNNKAVLAFNILSELPATDSKQIIRDSSIIIMPYQKSNFFETSGLKVIIPEGALYDTLRFRFTKSEGNGKLLSDIYHIHDRFTPVQKPITISIKPGKIIAGKESKLILVHLDENQKESYAGGSFSGGYVNADVLSFGNFAILIDTVPPVISSNGFTDGADLSDKKEIRMKITDDFSGIKAYTGIIDGKWALFEYDPRYDLLVYKFDPARITRSAKHKLILKITDNCNNSSTLTKEFFW